MADWREIPIHVIDFEGSDEYGIVEYGIVTLHRGEVVEAQTAICRARNPISLHQKKIIGLSYEETLNYLPFEQNALLFYGLRKTGVLGAHHASVENRLLKQYWAYPPSSPNFVEWGRGVSQWGPWIDTCKLYQIVYPGLASYKLMDLVEQFSLEKDLNLWVGEYCPKKRARPHCALYDALASALLLTHLGQLDEFKAMELEWLLLNSLARLEDKKAVSQLDFWV